jgi:hypothetical protein
LNAGSRLVDAAADSDPLGADALNPLGELLVTTVLFSELGKERGFGGLIGANLFPEFPSLGGKGSAGKASCLGAEGAVFGFAGSAIFCTLWVDSGGGGRAAILLQVGLVADFLTFCGEAAGPTAMSAVGPVLVEIIAAGARVPPLTGVEGPDKGGLVGVRFLLPWELITLVHSPSPVGAFLGVFAPAEAFDELTVAAGVSCRV